MLSLLEWEWCDMSESDIDIDEFDTDDMSSSSGVEDSGRVYFLFLFLEYSVWVGVFVEWEGSEKFEFHALVASGSECKVKVLAIRCLASEMLADGTELKVKVVAIRCLVSEILADSAELSFNVLEVGIES